MRQYPIYPLSLWLAALVCTALATEAAAQPSPQRVGIVVTTAVNVSDDEADALSAALGHALEEGLGVVVTAGAETRRRLPLDGLSEGCVADAACRGDLGQRLDADELLMLVVARVGTRVQVDTTWVDVATGKVASRPVLVLDTGAEPAEVFRGAGATLLPHIQPPPRPQGPGLATAGPGPGPGPARTVRTGRRMTTGVWIAAGVSAAALAGGASFGVLSLTGYGDLEERGCKTMACPASDIDTLARNGTAADILYGVSILAGATALVLYLSSDEEILAPAERAARPRSGARPLVGVGVGPGQVHIQVGGRF